MAAPLWFPLLFVVRRGYQRQGAVATIEVVRGGFWTERWPSLRVLGIIGLGGTGGVLPLR